MANHEQDPPETGGVFRWPEPGMPPAFGRAAGDREPPPQPDVAAWVPTYGPPRSLAAQAEPGAAAGPQILSPPPAFGAPPGAGMPDGGIAPDEPGRWPGAAPPWKVAGSAPAGLAGAPAGEWFVGGWEGSAPADPFGVDLGTNGPRELPATGWRRAVYHASGGRVRPPASAAQRTVHDLIRRAVTPVTGGHHRVAVLSLKGGVGKTTTAMGLGLTLATLRGDRVIAVDANPDRGTLCDKLRLETAATVRDLLNERGQIARYADVRAYTTQTVSGLEVLASDRDPTVSVAFGAQDYREVAAVLERYYSICITDCGTGLLHSAMAGVLGLADQIVLVSTPSVDGARSASATLDWLAAHHYGDLARTAVVVLAMVRRRSRSTVDLSRLEQHFASRCRAVVRVPFDTHLEEGAEMELAALAKPTADAFLTLAAAVADGFAP